MNMHRGRNTLTVAGAVAVALAAAAAGAQTEPAGLGEVIVTAQKRDERIQDVPVSVSVVPGARLTEGGSVQLTDYAAFVPGMFVDSNGTPGQSTISLRGIGPLGSSATVGIYIDETPVGSSGIYNSTSVLTFDLLPYDVERIEVLRGPQGTLYGASSIGGQLKYVTVAPSLDEFEGKVGAEALEVSGGSGTDFNYGARLSFPLVKDSLGLSLSYAKRDLPAYIDNVQTDESDINEGSQEGARVALLWQPSENTSLTLSALRQEVESDFNAQFMEDETGVALGNGTSINLFLDEPFESKLDLYSATLDFDLGFATLTSVTSYSDVEFLVTQDATRSFGALVEAILQLPPRTLDADLLNTFDQEKFTQEVRLTSSGDGQLEWLVGAFYTEETNNVGQLVSFYFPGTDDLVPGLNPGALVALPNEYQEYAVFANGTYRFSDAFRLSAGVRWAKNDQDFRQISSGALVPPANTPGESDEDVVTYSLSPEWHVNEDTMVYARVATGYRPGGFNVGIPSDIPGSGNLIPYDPEFATSYEAGFKLGLFGGRVFLEGAAYFTETDDVQIVTAASTTNTAFILQNGEGAEVWGAELEARGNFDAQLSASIRAALRLVVERGFEGVDTTLGKVVKALTQTSLPAERLIENLSTIKEALNFGEQEPSVWAAAVKDLTAAFSESIEAASGLGQRAGRIAKPVLERFGKR